ncbi:MAG TPA: GMC oxidoreductase, partial [Polyangiales bacterium]|nr:GMC oxidoreductase [Polyangiales bacterium]
PAAQRRNLDVMTDALVTRIVIEGGRATGVTIRRAGTEQTQSARTIVLSAGTYASPQILMLSGIGPAAQLRNFEIPVLVDAPEVGENLQDHPILPIVYGTTNTDTLLRAESPRELLRYLLFKRGMLASNGVEGFAFTQVEPGPVDAPDLELMFLPFEMREQFLEPPTRHAFGLGPAVVAPRSRGRVILRSNDPLVPLGIDPALLSDGEGIDARVLFEGVRLSRTIAATSPLAELNTGELRPGADVQSDRHLLDYASTELQTVYHPTSTCRMGSDARSVVDSRLRVRGIEALWIADASVMPAVPRGHPNAVVAMIANRGAAWIEEAVS